MSYSHTKRRKLIATLKRRYPRNWRDKFQESQAAAKRRIDGPLICAASDIAKP